MTLPPILRPDLFDHLASAYRLHLRRQGLALLAPELAAPAPPPTPAPAPPVEVVEGRPAAAQILGCSPRTVSRLLLALPAPARRGRLPRWPSPAAVLAWAHAAAEAQATPSPTPAPTSRPRPRPRPAKTAPAGAPLRLLARALGRS